MSKLLAEIARDGLVFVGAAFVIACAIWLVADLIPLQNPNWASGLLVGASGPGAILITRFLRRYLKA